MVDVLRENDTFVSGLRDAIRSGAGLAQVPGLLKCVLIDERWRRRVVQKTGAVAEFDRFEEFVVTKPLEGLGGSVDLIRRIVADDKEALDLLDRALQREPGNPTWVAEHTSEAIGLNQPNCTPAKRERSTRNLRRLRKDFPELHARVLANELTVHQAAVEAGIYPSRIVVNLQSAESAARTLQAKATPEFIRELIERLSDG